jgi:uncharacterized membrane protein YqjE
MPDKASPPHGILASVRRLCDTGLGLLQNRVELFALEVEEQKARLVRVLLLAALTVFLGNTAVLVITATIVVVVGPKARVPVLIGLSLFYVLAALLALLALRKEMAAAPPPFDDTVSELKKDREWLSSPS